MLIRLTLGSFGAVIFILVGFVFLRVIILGFIRLIIFDYCVHELRIFLSRPSLCTKGSNLQFLSKTITAVWAVIVSEEWTISATRRAQLRANSRSFWTQYSKSTIVVACRQVPWKFLINFSLRSVQEVTE